MEKFRAQAVRMDSHVPRFGDSIKGNKLCLPVWYSMKCPSTLGREPEAEEKVFTKILRFYLFPRPPLLLDDW